MNRPIFRFIVPLIIVMTLWSCRVVRQGQSSYHSDSETGETYKTVYEYIHDSVYVDQWHYIEVKGDTVYKTDSIVTNKHIVHTLYDTLRVTDTLRILDIDTVFNTTEVVPERYKKGMRAAIVEGIMLALIAIGGALILVYRLKK